MYEFLKCLQYCRRLHAIAIEIELTLICLYNEMIDEALKIELQYSALILDIAVRSLIVFIIRFL